MKNYLILIKKYLRKIEMTKCQQCNFGAMMFAFDGTVYSFILAVKKSKKINYKNGELGCRMDVWNDKEKRCLSNNFSEFQKFESDL